MVKADYKHDYYADLDLTSTADTETIKKGFRDLAKQYHPDRNPGREAEVVPKFQAIQAAHEILGDPIQKAKYDAERAKLNRSRDGESPSGSFKKPAAPPRTNSGHPNGQFPPSGSQPPPRKDPNTGQYVPQSSSRRPQSATASSADRFAQFARAAPPPQQWDRSRFEEAARQEGLRGMNAMRGGMPQSSPLRSHHPTAPRPAGADSYGFVPEPSPGFPGLNRTASQRRAYGARPPSGDDAPPSHSAYRHFHRSERERPPSAGGFAYVDPHKAAKDSESVSPLKQTRSFHSDDYSTLRPGLSRTSSRYARTGGERTQVNTTNFGRSTSVRDSPAAPEMEEHGPFGARAVAEERPPRPRYRSLSPKARAGCPKFEFSASDTTSDADDLPAPPDKPRAPLRRPHTQDFSRVSEEGPGLTGYFPNTNYTRVVDDNTYNFPPPQSKGTPVRRPFADMTSPIDRHDANLNGAAFDSPTHDETPKSRYEHPGPFTPISKLQRLWPAWAIPSSIPPKTLGGAKTLKSIVEEGLPAVNPLIFRLSSRRPTRGQSTFTDISSSSHEASSPEKRNPTFSATDWHETFDNHADMFQPPPPSVRDRKSPSKNLRNSRAGAGRSYVPTKDGHSNGADGDVDPHIAAGTRYVSPTDVHNKAAAFQSGKLPKDFANKAQAEGEVRHMFPSSSGERYPSTSKGPHLEAGPGGEAVRTPSDEMDVDSPVPPDTSSTVSSEGAYNVTVEEEHSPTSSTKLPNQQAHRHSSGTNGFDLGDLAKAAPFAPSETGLKDMKDLSANLPFQSRPSEDLEALHRTHSRTVRDLQLPRPPLLPYCPTDSNLDQHSWTTYGDAMTNYMHAWNKFNAAMIENFRRRQEAVTHGMWRNWVCAEGDGATAENYEASGGSDRAGFKTYMTWLEEDRKCRMWWDVAFEEHRVCMEGLGKVRNRVKALNSARGGRA